MSGCLAEDDLLELARGGALGDAPAAEAHLADCADCAALVAAMVAAEPAPLAWGALAGRALGPYRLDGQIGAGGMGAVYRAWDERLRRHVALKVLLRGDPRRVESEARAAAAIAHRNVVTVFDVGEADGFAYVVHELVEGETLRGVLERGALPRPRALALALDLARGLAAAHEKGVVHRDLKPENLVVSDGTLKILDFGLARLEGGGELDATEPGALQGTVGYMAPEQARGEPADARCDLFAAGAIIFEMLTGRRAFPGASHAERLTALLRDRPPLDDPAIGALAPILARCLEPEPRARFQSAADLAWLLERGLPAPAPRVTRRAWLAGAGVGLAGLAAGLWTGGRRRAPPAAPEFRQLTYQQGRIMSARFTRDATAILYGAAWDAGPLAAYAVRLDGGMIRPLDLPPADPLAVSARGELAVALGRRNVDGQHAAGQLAVVPIDGGVPRVLLDDVQEADFAPDGALAIVRRGGRGFRLELPAGNVLLEVDGWLTHARVSPDGRRLAALLHPTVGDDRGEVLLVERDGGRARSLSAGWASVAGLAWHPAGGALWFTGSRETANSALHSVTLDGERRVLVEIPGRLRLHDLAPDGRAAVTRDAWRLRTMAGRLGGPEVDRSLSDFSLVADLSPDGETLLLAEIGDVPAVNGSYLVPAGGGKSLRVGEGMALALSPDGERVAAILDGPRLVVHSTRSAEQVVLELGPIRRVSAARWIDGETLLVAGAERDRPARLWRVRAGAPPVAVTERAGRTLALDAARRRAAFVDATGRLVLVGTGGGDEREVAGDLRGCHACAFLDDDTLVVRGPVTALELEAIDLANGARRPYGHIAPPALGLKAVDAVVLHPATGRYAYSYGQELGQLYLMSQVS